jgi:hypothetical protein
MDEMANTDASSILTLRDTLREKRLSAAERLAQIDSELAATDTVIRLLGLEDREATERPTISSKDLHGKTQLDALIYIARQNENRIRVRWATRLLSEAGMLNGNRKNWYNMLVTIIKRSGKFEHVGPGEFELSEIQSPVVPIRRAQ